MRLFDSHCHFESTCPDEIRPVLERARAAGVERLLAVGGSDALNAGALAAQKMDFGLRTSDFGLRSGETPLPQEGAQENQSPKSKVQSPLLQDSAQENQSPKSKVQSPFPQDSAQENQSPKSKVQSPFPQVDVALGFDREQIGKPLPDFPVCAVRGEIGLDYHYSPETRDAQRALFAAQLEDARRRDLPVSIHTRDADADTLALLREIPSRGVIHCFTGSPDFARALLDLGFFVSISGIVTFRAADNVRASALVVPDDRLLIETDAPFLAPVPLRGRANEPAFLVHTCTFLAALRGVAPEALADLTFANAERCFARVAKEAAT